MTNEERIEQLLAVVRVGVEMRTAQAAYFRGGRQTADLIASKNAEKAFDAAACRALTGFKTSSSSKT